MYNIYLTELSEGVTWKGIVKCLAQDVVHRKSSVRSKTYSHQHTLPPVLEGEIIAGIFSMFFFFCYLCVPKRLRNKLYFVQGMTKLL